MDLEYNRITTSRRNTSHSEPELSLLRDEMTKLLHPSVVGIDLMTADLGDHVSTMLSWAVSHGEKIMTSNSGDISWSL